MSRASEGDCQRRGRILEAAAELFQHYGFAKTTVADIARQAEVGVGSVYLEFHGKDAILEALSARRYELVLEAMTQASQGEDAFPDRLTRALDARAETFLRLADGGTHAPELVFCHCPGTVAAFSRFREDERALIAGLLAEGAASGALVVADPQREAATLLAAYSTTSPPLLFKRPGDQTRALLADLHL